MKTPQKAFKRTIANERMAEYDSMLVSQRTILQPSENWEETLLKPSPRIKVERTGNESVGY
jgi:hypothetical protein